MSAYAQAVVAGSIVAGPHVRNACRRHLKDSKDGPKRGLRWDIDAAQRALSFFPDVLRLAGGQFEGLPFQLQPSQQFIVGSLFGWKRKDGFRRFRRAYIEEGKGNGKSPLAAGIGLYGMMADGEDRAEVYAAASDRDQAMVLFRDAVAMVDQSPALDQRITQSGENPVWQLTDLKTASFFKPLSREKRKKGSGPRPHFALCDEVHEHPDRDIIEMLERGFKWRRQPLLLMITNSGSDRDSICWEEHDYAVRLAAGTETPDEDYNFVGEAINDEAFSYVCALDRDDDPLEDPACWPKVNPLLGVTITEEYLAGVVRQAKAMPGKLNGVLRLHFCVWTDAEEAWMSRKALEAVLADFDPAEHQEMPVYVGIDLSGSQDLTAMAFVVETGSMEIERDDPGSGPGQAPTTVTLPTYDAWIEAWTPGDTIKQRAEADRAPYDLWHDQGFLHAPPGKHIRLDFVAARLAEVTTEYRPALVAYDRYAFRKFEEECEALGLTLHFIEHPQGGKRRAKPPEESTELAKALGQDPPQGLWMPGSVRELENLILDQRIRLKRNPVLIRACMSAACDTDPFDNRWFVKAKSMNRIDALVALAMAVGVATSGIHAEPATIPEDYQVRVWG